MTAINVIIDKVVHIVADAEARRIRSAHPALKRLEDRVTSGLASSRERAAFNHAKVLSERIAAGEASRTHRGGETSHGLPARNRAEPRFFSGAEFWAEKIGRERPRGRTA
jgi:hypothetical protein